MAHPSTDNRPADRWAPAAVPTAALEADAAERRDRLSHGMDALSGRLAPASIANELVDYVQRSLLAVMVRLADDSEALARDLWRDGSQFVGRHRRAVVGGTLLAALAGAVLWRATRRRTVPLYAAYDMEDPEMMNDQHPARGWDRVREGAEDLGDKGARAYYAARSRAAELTDDAVAKAREAAEEARRRAHEAAVVAREKAQEAADAAREAAERAREAAGEARDWAVRQPQENPVGVVIVALALGAIAGALLPSGRGRRA